MLIALALFCTVLEAVFTALEVALGAVSRSQLRTLAEARPDGHEKGQRSGAALAAQARRANLALTLTERPERLTLLFITVTSLSLWTAAGSLTWQALNTPWQPWVLAVSLLGVLFVAEVLPLLIAAPNPDAVALRGAALVKVALKVFAPVLWLVGSLAFFTARVLGSGPNPTAALTGGELRSALATAEEEGVIEADERAMLEGAMDFRDTVVREVMTRRVDMVAVPCSATLPETLEVALREGHSRLPVYDGTIDRIVGIVATKDLLPHLKRGVPSDLTVKDVVRPPIFVPDTKAIDATLEDLRKQRTLLAIVVEADGGTAGLVTIEDLLEELVGEIQDEYDVEEPPLTVIEGGPLEAVSCDAGSTVRDFGRFWERSFHMQARLKTEENVDADASTSLAALALELFQSVPSTGDRIRCGAAQVNTGDTRVQMDLELEIAAMDGPRIERVIIRLVKNAD